jgi:hypothetical protein
MGDLPQELPAKDQKCPGLGHARFHTSMDLIYITY